MSDWKKAGEIAAKAREYGRQLVNEGAKTLDIAEAIEAKVVELGGKPAFPCGVSINHIAAHASPMPGETTILKRGDVVKLDLGAHINGCVADTACTIEVGSNENKDLILASKEALEEAIKHVKVGVKVSEIGRVIHKVINSYGFSPIKNLSGHGIKEWVVHHELTIPNFDNGDTRQLKEGMHVAIEPFATTGKGLITEGKASGIYAINNIRNVRSFEARKLLKHIQEEYQTLPFHIRWLKAPNVNFLVRVLEREGVLRTYPQLVEESKGLVSQAEHSIEVGKGVYTN